MIKLSGARDEPDSSILNGLQTAVEIVTRQTRKHRIAVIEPRENKACYEHCTCATGQTAPNATNLSQDTKSTVRRLVWFLIASATLGVFTRV